MTVYGDLDVSVLDELPPGRTPIVTAWAQGRRSTRPRCGQQVRDEVAAGRQAYVVCPLIEESEKLEVRSAEETFERAAPRGELAGLRVGLLHGRVAAGRQGGRSWARSARGDLDVLVATTVIEVGVDVPNATVMVILDADRFGIAQLHQLRGRVGRGAATSRCAAWSARPPRPTARRGSRRWCARPTASSWPRSTSTCGARARSWASARRAATTSSWRRCAATASGWSRAREVAFELVDADPTLEQHRLLAEEVDLLLGEKDAEFLLKG